MREASPWRSIQGSAAGMAAGGGVLAPTQGRAAEGSRSAGWSRWLEASVAKKPSIQPLGTALEAPPINPGAVQRAAPAFVHRAPDSYSTRPRTAQPGMGEGRSGSGSGSGRITGWTGSRPATLDELPENQEEEHGEEIGSFQEADQDQQLHQSLGAVFTPRSAPRRACGDPLVNAVCLTSCTEEAEEEGRGEGGAVLAKPYVSMAETHKENLRGLAVLIEDFGLHGGSEEDSIGSGSITPISSALPSPAPFPLSRASTATRPSTSFSSCLRTRSASYARNPDSHNLPLRTFLEDHKESGGVRDAGTELGRVNTALTDPFTHAPSPPQGWNGRPAAPERAETTRTAPVSQGGQPMMEMDPVGLYELGKVHTPYVPGAGSARWGVSVSCRYTSWTGPGKHTDVELETGAVRAMQQDMAAETGRTKAQLKEGKAVPNTTKMNLAGTNPFSWNEIEYSCRKLDEANIRICEIDLTCVAEEDNELASPTVLYNFELDSTVSNTSSHRSSFESSLSSSSSYSAHSKASIELISNCPENDVSQKSMMNERHLALPAKPAGLARHAITAFKTRCAAIFPGANGPAK